MKVKESPRHSPSSVVMLERWGKANVLTLPMLDQNDIVNENPHFSAQPKSFRHQANPEYTQSSYLRMREMESAYKMTNYMNLPEKPLSLTQRIQQSISFGSRIIPKEHRITDYDRSYGIQKIFDLHAKKEYKPESLFIAAGIFDRYLHMMGLEHVPKTEVVSLSVISVLLSAKLEQPISPSFARMINLLTDEEKALTNK